jgi:hypothetical protein
MNRWQNIAAARGGKTKASCGACRREVAYNSPTSNKARVKHRCPHGEWCIAGFPLKYSSQGWNWPLCLQCLNDRRAERGLPPVKKVSTPNPAKGGQFGPGYL